MRLGAKWCGCSSRRTCAREGGILVHYAATSKPMLCAWQRSDRIGSGAVDRCRSSHCRLQVGNLRFAGSTLHPGAPVSLPNRRGIGSDQSSISPFDRTEVNRHILSIFEYRQYLTQAPLFNPNPCSSIQFFFIPNRLLNTIHPVPATEAAKHRACKTTNPVPNLP